MFFSIQGEGSRAGRPCVFVRLTGCPLRCVWCDTAYAFHEGARRGEEELAADLRRFPSRLVCLTGGEPLAQPDAFPFVTRLVDEGWEVVIETSGHVPLGPLDPRAVAIMDVKTPGSGESRRMEWANLDELRAADEVKLVSTGAPTTSGRATWSSAATSPSAAPSSSRRSTGCSTPACSAAGSWKTASACACRCSCTRSSGRA